MSTIESDIVARIVGDLTDRRGIRHAWADVDEDIQAEIVAKWGGIVRGAAAGVGRPDRRGARGDDRPAGSDDRRGDHPGHRAREGRAGSAREGRGWPVSAHGLPLSIWAVIVSVVALLGGSIGVDTASIAVHLGVAHRTAGIIGFASMGAVYLAFIADYLLDERAIRRVQMQHGAGR